MPVNKQNEPQRKWVLCFKCEMRLEAIMFRDSMSVICPNCGAENWFNAEHGIDVEKDDLDKEIDHAE